ncbi:MULTISPECIES: phage GP46 family protein [Pasteurellaceae]|uniref:Phage GP46 family protein n=1 Tax=Pasteurella atlantica TaxID=2827233 RepID=A0AAW8CP55_9PAST|nr:phage GP46 family protein [Pasteurella atlantica]MBR0574065.1 phage GP46 family protein [Pasteurella atlantica]MDP8040112.1 phage GP46 family protein [Pasteurella atlantica]MDP8042225.1 phage GP46 family protein [Pasteurella atlantica]MDP8044368.1 phage GP46 family protein [Pasteurella atlantica]MDP8046384.1 phage GP46 family protein [Pasteurella atlantica]
MDREINPQTRDYSGKQINTLQNAVYIRLTKPLGFWWADKSLGSLLHTLNREKDLKRVGLLSQQYAEEALQPLVDDGRAKEIIVTHTQPNDGYLFLHIKVTDNRGELFEFKHPVKVI